MKLSGCFLMVTRHGIWTSQVDPCPICVLITDIHETNLRPKTAWRWSWTDALRACGILLKRPPCMRGGKVHSFVEVQRPQDLQGTRIGVVVGVCLSVCTTQALSPSQTVLQPSINTVRLPRPRSSDLVQPFPPFLAASR